MSNANLGAHINKPDYSTFDLSHLHRTSFDMGELIPISVIPVMPGDKFNVSVDAFIRGMPTEVPIVDKVDIKINHFYVPYRVLWNAFEDFYTQSDDYKFTGASKPAIPTVFLQNDQAGNYKNGRLADYLGLSNVNATPQQAAVVSALPFLAYQKIYLDYYVPQRWVEYMQSASVAHPLLQLKSSLENAKKSQGGNLYTSNYSWLMSLRRVGWNHDYFTNALPTPTLFGDVKLPLFTADGQLPNSSNTFMVDVDELNFDVTGAGHGPDNFDKLATIRDLRKSIAVQHYLEKLQIGGGRYLETLKVMWNQDIKSEVLQRSQYLGGDVIPLFVNEVESNAGTEQNNLGDVSGKPIGAGRFDSSYMEADEFGIYMCLAHVVPKRSYSDAVDRMFTSFDVMDFPNPEFEGIGDQAVYTTELNGDFTNKNIFGYVPRYSEYKGRLDRFSGEMRFSLKHWHMGSFKTDMVNSICPEFIECNPRTDIFKVPGEPDKLLGSFQMNIKAKRKLSANPIVGLGRI